MFKISFTKSAEDTINNTLGKMPPNRTGEKLVGINITKNGKDYKLSYLYHFVGSHMYIGGDNLDIGVCPFPNNLTEINNINVDYINDEFLITEI